MCMQGMGVSLGSIVGALGGAAEYGAEVEDFNARETMWQQNYVNSLASGREEQVALQTKAFQEQQLTTQKLEEYNREGAEKAAYAEVSAASSGVAGNSVTSLVRNILGAAGRNRYVARENGKATAAQITNELKATGTRMVNRINSVARPSKPTAAGAMLKIMGGFVGGMA